MKFMDVVTNGVLQAFRKMARAEHRQDKVVGPIQAQRLLRYKRERVARFVLAGKGRLHIVVN